MASELDRSDVNSLNHAIRSPCEGNASSEPVSVSFLALEASALLLFRLGFSNGEVAHAGCLAGAEPDRESAVLSPKKSSFRQLTDRAAGRTCSSCCSFFSSGSLAKRRRIRRTGGWTCNPGFFSVFSMGSLARWRIIRTAGRACSSGWSSFNTFSLSSEERAVRAIGRSCCSDSSFRPLVFLSRCTTS